MKARWLALAVLVSCWVLVLPVASAENLWFEIQAMDEHPAGHGDIVLPENGRKNIELKVGLNAGNFTCAAGAEMQVSVGADVHGFPDWAGAAPNPDPTEGRFELPPGDPGLTTTKTYANQGDRIFFEIAWNVEERPAQDARFNYTIELRDLRWLEGQAGCLPENFPDAHLGSLTLPVRMPDKNLSEDPSTCPPGLPGCDLSGIRTEGGGEASGLAASFALAVAGIAAFGRRRRS